ncbi:MAG: hypothetical protein DDT37_01628 [Firmicutes bacterium]|nr:hypothetical protein [candidate division NPL-UPA2 bacterium]
MLTSSIPRSPRTCQAALFYARHYGWHVLPVHSTSDGKCSCGKLDCSNPGKHPRTTHGIKDASIDLQTISAWWTQWPDASVAVATGTLSGFFVLDIDGEDGASSLRELEQQHGTLPDTIEQITGGGGRHILFAMPPQKIKNRVAVGAGLDIRADGGYIVVAPSTHASGTPYHWELSSRPDSVPLADAPEWLLTLVSAPAKKTALDPAKILAGVSEGSRDETLFRYACRLRAQKLSRPEVETLIQRAAATCVPPFSPEQAAAKVHAAWGYDTAPAYHHSDYGNAERLTAQHGEDIRYCWPWQRWLIWDGTRWAQDATGAIISRAKGSIRSAYAEAGHITGDDVRKQFLAHVLRSESRDRLAAMAALAASEPGIPVQPEDIDTDPWLLTVGNGTLDLRTGNLRPHRRQDLISKKTAVEYDPAAKCPRWARFLHEIMDSNQSLVDFLQRAVGVSLTGDVSEHALYILHGTGRNGKTTFLEVLGALLGEYATTAPPDLLMAKPTAQHPTELTALFGARFVASSESSRGGQLAEPLVKQLTGGDKITARRMREDFWTFAPTHKLWLATNHPPRVRGTDLAIWSRLKIIPFTRRFLGTARDPRLKETLRTELQGILTWAVAGCLAWQAQGLSIPAEVDTATAAHRTQQDILAPFLADQCRSSKTYRVAAADLYQAYTAFCLAGGDRPLAGKTFGQALAERGYLPHKGSAGRRYWLGLELIGSPD